MSPHPHTNLPRNALLQLRCEAQRQQLALEFGALKNTLRKTETTFTALRRVATQPAFILGGLTLLLLLKRNHWWKLISRSMLLFTTAKNIYRFFRQQTTNVKDSI